MFASLSDVPAHRPVPRPTAVCFRFPFAALRLPPPPTVPRHLDADEAAALGAGLFAANLSTSFRLRKFGMVDLTMYGVSLTLDHVVMGEAPAEGAEVRGLVVLAGRDGLLVGHPAL